MKDSDMANSIIINRMREQILKVGQYKVLEIINEIRPDSVRKRYKLYCGFAIKLLENKV